MAILDVHYGFHLQKSMSYGPVSTNAHTAGPIKTLSGYFAVT